MGQKIRDLDRYRDSDSTGVRSPTQTRGHARRNAILDAAAAIIIETGTQHATMQTVAHRAGASVRSMYHFFRNRDDILAALADRHTDELNAIIDENRKRPDSTWKELSARSLVDQVFGRLLRYYVDHPDALILLHLQDDADSQAFLDTLERIIKLRMTSHKGAETAALLYAVSSGSLLFATAAMPDQRSAIILGISEVLTAYIERLEH